MRLMALLASLLLCTVGLLSAPAQGDEPVVLPLPMDDAVRGRAIFNRRGGCANCHGRDGYIGRRPRQADSRTRRLEKLNPQPADLRNASALKAKDDTERFSTIKFGHPRTAMYAKKNLLRDTEIADLLVYLAVLRAEGPGEVGSGGDRHR